MPKYLSYVICGTPRSGSTLLCEMLAATGVAGRPNSFFRQQSLLYWADRWDMPALDDLDAAEFDRAYLQAMLHYGRAETSTFGLRIMWSSVAEAATRMDRVYGGHADVPARFEQAFGPALYVHLSRGDKVAQAVSLVRAEQSGLWHLAADGSVYEGVAAPRPNVYDAQRIAEVFVERTNDDIAWESFFATHGIEPLRLTYEALTAEPQAELAKVLAALGRNPSIAKGVSVATRKMGDGTSAQWVARFRSEFGLSEPSVVS